MITYGTNLEWELEFLKVSNASQVQGGAKRQKKSYTWV
jgi:hypothetical protein